MRLRVINKLKSIVYLNTNGVPVPGESEAIVNADTNEKKLELSVLYKKGYLDIAGIYVNFMPKDEIEEHVLVAKNLFPNANIQICDETKRNIANKERLDQIRVNEATKKTNLDGSSVVIGNGGGSSRSKMVKSALDIIEDPIDMQKTASIETDEETPPQIKEEDLPIQDRMGSTATIAMPNGQAKHVDMVNNIVPYSEEIKDKDPFIDRDDANVLDNQTQKEEKRKRGRPKGVKKIERKTDNDPFVDEKNNEASDAFIDDKDDDYGKDAFIEI